MYAMMVCPSARHEWCVDMSCYYVGLSDLDCLDLSVQCNGERRCLERIGCDGRWMDGGWVDEEMSRGMCLWTPFEN